MHVIPPVYYHDIPYCGHASQVPLGEEGTPWTTGERTPTHTHNQSTHVCGNVHRESPEPTELPAARLQR